jgi:hypothetical protein
MVPFFTGPDRSLLNSFRQTQMVPHRSHISGHEQFNAKAPDAAQKFH